MKNALDDVATRHGSTRSQATTGAITLAAVFALGASLACRPKTFGGPTAQDAGSQVASLDNMARDDGAAAEINRCGLELTDTLPEWAHELSNQVVAPDDRLRQVALATLAAAPKRFIANVFGPGGRLLVTGEARRLCEGSLFDDERIAAGKDPRPRACWKEAAKGVLDLIVDADERLIRHGTVRLLSYANVDYYAARVAPNPAASNAMTPEQFAQAKAAFEAGLTKLATTFLKETEGRQAYPRLAAFAAASPQRFRSYVYAEAVDSYFCSETAKGNFHRAFPLSYADFEAPTDPFGPLGQLQK
jgi:hypothetical protein